MKKRVFTKEHRKHLSEAQKKNPVRFWLGKKRSQETKDKIREKARIITTAAWREGRFKGTTGYHPSEKNRLATSRRATGNKYAEGYKHSPEAKRKIAEGNRGKTLSASAKLKISNANKGKFIGSKSCRWKGDAVKEKRDRTSFEISLWRKSVFERDNYTCIFCGARSGKNKKVVLNADHIKPFAYFPELRLAIDNGRTLCEPCHRKTDTYGGRAIKYGRLL